MSGYALYVCVIVISSLLSMPLTTTTHTHLIYPFPFIKSVSKWSLQIHFSDGIWTGSEKKKERQQSNTIDKRERERKERWIKREKRTAVSRLSEGQLHRSLICLRPGDRKGSSIIVNCRGEKEESVCYWQLPHTQLWTVKRRGDIDDKSLLTRVEKV